MWSLHLSAKTYSQSPADLFGIANRPLAWMFNDRVLEFGLYIENRLAERDKKGKPVHSAAELLREPGEKPAKVDNAASAAKLARMAGVKVVG